MKKILLITSILTICYGLRAQDLLVENGSSLSIKSGTSFSVSGLVLTPSSDYTFNGGIGISKSTTIVNPAQQSYISRVYKLSSTATAFTGSIRINYLDAELNGIPEPQLALNINDGIIWEDYPSIVDEISNYVVSSNINGAPLNELTLAFTSSPLPLTWLSFTALKNGNNAQLDWRTANENSTRDFEPQQSADGITWKKLSLVAASGSNTASNAYRYIDVAPAKGWNYYRILQRDQDARISYSEMRKLNFEVSSRFTVLNNPVTDGEIRLKVYAPVSIQLFNSDGKLLVRKMLQPGNNILPLNNYAKGVYIISSGAQTERIILQ